MNKSAHQILKCINTSIKLLQFTMNEAGVRDRIYFEESKRHHRFCIVLFIFEACFSEFNVKPLCWRLLKINRREPATDASNKLKGNCDVCERHTQARVSTYFTFPIFPPGKIYGMVMLALAYYSSAHITDNYVENSFFFSIFLWCGERCTLSFFRFFNCKWQNVCIDRLSGQHGVVSLCSGSLLFLLKFEIWFIQYLRIRFDVTQSTSCFFSFSFEIQITNNQLIFNKRIISTKPIAFWNQTLYITPQ